MKKFFLLLTCVFMYTIYIFPNGVAIGNAVSGAYLKLLSSEVDVTVQNQVSIVKTTQIFQNKFSADTLIKYAFPLTEKQSATKLRWKVNGVWKEASFSASPQDTSLPGPPGQIAANLKTYLGLTPLYFGIPDTIAVDSTLEVELTYVEFLHYSFGNVMFNYKNKYNTLQSSTIDTQHLIFNIYSQRTIDSVLFLSHSGAIINNYGDSAKIEFLLNEQIANADYKLQYSLSSTQFGLFGLSTFLSDSINFADSTNGGYFLFVAEPAPSDAVISKVFTFIIDRSGSMLGNKMTQAKNAANFIVNNLNEGDKFNIIDFSTDVSSFRPEHVLYTTENKQAALNYISVMQATGLTNISGAFSSAIPQFNSTDTTTANIIIFFTDGQATTGITNTQQIVTHVNQLVTQSERVINIFSFGIGLDANKQLLTLLSVQNNGLADFLDDNQLEEKISEFYLKIRNPVLVNTQVEFTPSVTISEIYPEPLPNIYKGQQLLMAGRYSEASPISVTLSGKAFGYPVQYQYQINLADTNISGYLFLMKVWAKSKIDYLTIQYYLLSPNSAAAIALRQQIIALSIKYGVISIFTSFNSTIDVEMLSFTGVTMSDGVVLEWRTSTETNNAGFYIERLYGNQEWKSIGYVEGGGTSVYQRSYSFKDQLNQVIYKGYVSYRIRQIDYDGSVTYIDPIEVFINTVPEEFHLEQNFPNPFNPATTIYFTLPLKENVVLKVYDVLGNEIAELVNGVHEAGTHAIVFNAGSLSSGIYFYRIEAGSFKAHRKMLIIK